MRTLARDPVADNLKGLSSATPTAATAERHGDDFDFTSADDAGNPIVVTLSRVREAHDAIWAEVAVSRNGSELYFERINLLSSRRNSVLKTLTERAPDIEWTHLLDPACRQAIEAIRCGTPAVVLRARPAPPVRHLVTPVLLENEINVIFGPPGVMKSLLGAVLARLVASQGELAGLAATRQGPVLILDGESNPTEWEGRMYLLGQADGRPTDGLIHYRRLARSLDAEAATLKTEASRLGVRLVIVDSFGIAAGAEPEGADAAIRLLSTLRSLGPTVTVLLICHVSQVSAEQKHGATKPYGSIYVQALGRSIWEARRDEDGGDEVMVGLYHRKCNATKLHPPLAFRFRFEADRISVEGGKVEDSPDLLARASLAKRVSVALKTGALTVAELAEHLQASEDTVRTTIRRMHDRKGPQVTQVGDSRPAKWGLVAR